MTQCESDEEKAFSREDFNQNRNLYKKIKEHLKEIMECKIKNSAELEDFQYLLKNNINKYKQEIFSIAQQMYYHMQELNSEVNLRYAELTKNEELLQKNEKVFEEKVNKLKLIETKFKKQLEFKEKEEAEDTRKKDLEIRTMSLENEEIKAEIKILDQQIEYYEHYFKSDSAVLDDEINYEMVIENLQKSIKSKENEIQELSKLSEEAKQFRKALQNEEHARILELDNQ